MSLNDTNSNGYVVGNISSSLLSFVIITHKKDIINMKTMFSGGSFDLPLFRLISRDQLIQATSSKASLLSFVNTLGFDFDNIDDLIETITSVEKYSIYSNSQTNMSINDIQKEMLKAFDDNSIFYFMLMEEGLTSFVAFTDNIRPID